MTVDQTAALLRHLPMVPYHYAAGQQSALCQVPSTAGRGASSSHTCFSGAYVAAVMLTLAAGASAAGLAAEMLVVLVRRLGTYLRARSDSLGNDTERREAVVKRRLLTSPIQYI